MKTTEVLSIVQYCWMKHFLNNKKHIILLKYCIIDKPHYFCDLLCIHASHQKLSYLKVTNPDSISFNIGDLITQELLLFFVLKEYSIVFPFVTEVSMIAWTLRVPLILKLFCQSVFIMFMSGAVLNFNSWNVSCCKIIQLLWCIILQDLFVMWPL